MIKTYLSVRCLKNKKPPPFFSKSRLINNKNLSQYYNSQIKYESEKKI